MLQRPLDSESENYAQYIFDLFILCLSWQWDPNYYNSMWTTMERVANILKALGIITEQQRLELPDNEEVQQIFASNISRPILDHDKCIWDGKNVTEKQRKIILNATTKLVISAELRKNVNRKQLVGKNKLHLTNKGNAYAQRITEKYANEIDSDDYLEELQRQHESISRMKPENDYE